MRTLTVTGTALVAFAIAGTVSSAVGAQQPFCGGSSAVLNGGGISFSIDSVAGWKFDCNAGRDENFLIVLHRPSESSSVNWGLMYAAILPLSDDEHNSAEARINADLARRRNAAVDVVVSTAGRVQTKDGSTVGVRQFVSKTRHSYELVAYIPSGTAVPVLGPKAFTERALTANRPAFDRLVRSFAVVNRTVK